MTIEEAKKEMMKFVRLKTTQLPVFADVLMEAELVVRCKDCKYSYEDLQSRVCAYGRCLNCDVSDDWFCADGERKEE